MEHAGTIIAAQKCLTTSSVEHVDSMIAMQGKIVDCTKNNTERYEETCDAITSAHEKLIEYILRAEIKIVQGLQKIGTSVESAADKICDSVQTVVTANEQLLERQAKSVNMMQKSEKALDLMVRNLERLSLAHEKANKEHRTLVESESTFKYFF